MRAAWNSLSARLLSDPLPIVRKVHLNRRTIRISRLKSATLVSAGAVAVALSVVPSAVAVADAASRPDADRSVVRLRPIEHPSVAIADAIRRAGAEGQAAVVPDRAMRSVADKIGRAHV